MGLSKRLNTIVDQVKPGARVADIGTDHGYVPIELIQSGIATYVYALDVQKGPLEKAKANIYLAGLEGQIETILSDGLTHLPPDSVDTIIIAGMGGMLMARILMSGKAHLKGIKRMVLSPHHDTKQVRQSVHVLGYQIVHEVMVEEAGQYYEIMVCEPGTENYKHDYEYAFGKCLISNQDPVFKKYLTMKLAKIQVIQAHLCREDSCMAANRLKDLEQEAKNILEVLSWL